MSDIAFAGGQIGAMRDRAERGAAYVIAALLLLSMVGLKFVGGEREALTGDGDVLRQLSYVAVFGFVVFALGFYRRPLSLVRMPTALALLLIWCALSLTWSVEPSVGLRRLSLTMIVILTIFAATSRAGPDLVIRFARQALLIVLVANFIAIATSGSAIHSPSAGDPAIAGAWRGVTEHKNVAGAICALTILFYAFTEARMRFGWRWLIIIAAAVFLYWTKSKTSGALVLVALLCGQVYLITRPRTRAALIALLVLAAAFALVVHDGLVADISSFALGDDVLTGRGDIWQVLVAYAQTNPLFGAGYGSFWNVGASSPAFAFARNWVSGLASGHNGYLDLLVTIGVPGLLLALYATIVAPAGRLVRLDAERRSTGALLLSVLVFCAGHNLTESTLLDRDATVWVFQLLVVAVSYKLSNDQRAGGTS